MPVREADEVTFQLPDALAADDDSLAVELLTTYFGRPFRGPGAYDGAFFDGWSSQRSGAEQPDVFTADDLIAVKFLSIDVSAAAARALLLERRDEFAALLADVGEDRDLAGEPVPLISDWPAWRLDTALQGLPDVGPTTSSKLLARKRPRLVPIWDSVVTELTGTRFTLWEPLRLALRADDKALHRRLERLRRAAGLPGQVSVLRVFDVVCWMEGKRKGLGTRRY